MICKRRGVRSSDGRYVCSGPRGCKAGIGKNVAAARRGRSFPWRAALCMFAGMKALALFAATMLASTLTVSAADPDTRVFEMRTYYSPAGKLDDLHARFRDHTTKLFTKHGMTNIGYWVPIENAENKLVYVLAYPSREAREASWKAFMGDPDWQAAYKASEVNGKLVEKVEQIFMTATDFSGAGTSATSLPFASDSDCAFFQSGSAMNASHPRPRRPSSPR